MYFLIVTEIMVMTKIVKFEVWSRGVTDRARLHDCMIMQILVQLTDLPGEWGIVELQGVLETRRGRSFEGLHIGDLHLNTITGTASLIVGHHLLTGKAVKLDKPLGVLRKSSTATTSTSTTEYCVIALVRRKIVFKNRPKPIVSATVPKRT